MNDERCGTVYENYFEITKESPHYDEWFDYLKADDNQREIMRSFAKEHDINIEEYMIWKDKLWVRPDLNEIYSSQFGKEREQGTAPFKKTSPIGKAFSKISVVKARKPFVPWFFKDHYGKSQFREFDCDGKVYCQFNTEYETDEVPKGFVRIKASEFYKAIEQKESAKE